MKLFPIGGFFPNSLYLLFVAAIFASGGCSSDDRGNGLSGTVFLVGSEGDGDSWTPGLYTMTVKSGEASFDLVTDLVTQYTSIQWASQRNGRIAFRVVPNQTPEDTSGVAYMDVGNLTNIQFAPIPDAPVDHYFSVNNERPWLTEDGRIAYRVTLETDNEYDDAHWGQLAIFDPKSGEVELSGDPSSFVLAQPEQGTDTEGGSMGGSFLLSPDDRYAYASVYGYGTDMGVYHQDNFFVVRYEIGTPGSYERMAITRDAVTAITADGAILVLTGDGLHQVDTSEKTIEKVDDYANVFNPGQVSRKGSQMLKVWRGSGMGVFDMSQNPPWLYSVIEGENMSGDYRGLGHGAQYSLDEQSIYFTASTDFYTNGDTPLKVFKTPIVENNTEPEEITEMPQAFCTGFFMLLSD